MKNKYICIHGHFYQPPRENAWLEEVEMQDSAAPFHDWNERVNFECYAPNTAARILDEHQFITKIINNYGRISFNFGPTLLSWMEHADSETYRAILAADKKSAERFSGHGSALAQIHSHLIMPLANQKDKETQVKWGIADFVYRFGRKPEGIWLSETAVNTATLEILVENDIKFTILAPRQAKAFRKIGGENWTALPNTDIDPRQAYLYRLPSGKTITLFFYDGNIAQDVAFNGMLNNGKDFANRLTGTFDDDNKPQLVHIATDGETYGHHHRYGEMALAACLNHIEENQLAKLTNYAEFLEFFPPRFEVQIHEQSSWSCVHGVERWRSNCGCTTGSRDGWTQEWRAPLRQALDWLRNKLIPIYEGEADKLIKDPWEARNDYIEVLLKRTNTRVRDFIQKYSKRQLDKKEKTQLLRLMEMQRHAMLMFTSCGWFFAEISSIETNQILQYACRAIRYAEQVAGIELQEEFIRKLEAAPSNIKENGAVSYREDVLPARVDLARVGMHYAASSLFEEYSERHNIFNYTAKSNEFERVLAGFQKLVVGRTHVTSQITKAEKLFSFAVLYLGQQNIIGNISVDMPLENYKKMQREIIEAFKSTNLGDVIGLMQDYFHSEKFSIWHLFRDEKRKILWSVFGKSIPPLETATREFYEDNYQLMTGLQKSNIPVPEVWIDAAQYIVNRDFYRFFKHRRMSILELERLEEEFKKWNIPLSNEQSFKLRASERIFQEIKVVAQVQVDLENLERLNKILETLERMGVQLDIWKSQNHYFSLIKGYQRGEWVFANEEWKTAFMKLGDLLKVRSS